MSEPKKIGGYEVHPAAELFPMLPEKELQELADDILSQGLNEPVVLFDGKILDGRNRLAACERAGVKPRFKYLDGDKSPAEFVLSSNLKRRHLTTAEKALVAKRVLPMLEAEAKARQRMAAEQTNGALKEIVPEAQKGQARDKAAALVGVNPRYVSDLKKIEKESPEIYAKCESGEIKSIPEAKRQMEAEQAPSKPQPVMIGNTGIGNWDPKAPLPGAKDPYPLKNLKSAWRTAGKRYRGQFLAWAGLTRVSSKNNKQKKNEQHHESKDTGY